MSAFPIQYKSTKLYFRAFLTSFFWEMENSEPEAFLWALTLGAGEREASLPAIQNSRASPFVSSALG